MYVTSERAASMPPFGLFLLRRWAPSCVQLSWRSHFAGFVTCGIFEYSKRLRITGEVRKQAAKSRCGGEFGLLFRGLLLIGGLHSDEELVPFDMPA